jgi:hypothetical protein
MDESPRRYPPLQPRNLPIGHPGAQQEPPVDYNPGALNATASNFHYTSDIGDASINSSPFTVPSISSNGAYDDDSVPLAPTGNFPVADGPFQVAGAGSRFSGNQDRPLQISASTHSLENQNWADDRYLQQRMDICRK